MQKIKIVCIGTIKDSFYVEAIDEYKKRLRKYCDFEIVELPEVLPSSKCNDAQIKDREAEEIIKALSGFVVVMDLRGNEISSEDLAKLIQDRAVYSDSKVTFVIGGSLGLGESVLKRADLKIRVGKMTFLHTFCNLFILLKKRIKISPKGEKHEYFFFFKTVGAAFALRYIFISVPPVRRCPLLLHTSGAIGDSIQDSRISHA